MVHRMLLAALTCLTFSVAGTSSHALSPTGPWLVYIKLNHNQADELWAANFDGSSPTLLATYDHTTGETLSDSFTFLAPSPTGPYVAFASGGTDKYDIRLNLLELPDGKIKQIARTITPQVALQQKYDPDLFWRELNEFDNLAWSPDGHILGFIGVSEAQASELFEYSLQDSKVFQLTNEAVQPTDIHWSPQGDHIVFQRNMTTQVVSGPINTNIWKVGTKDRKLEKLLELSAQDLAQDSTLSINIRSMQWLGPATFTFTHQNLSCQDYELRSLNIETKEVKELFPGIVSGYAVSPESNKMLLQVSSGGCDFKTNQDSGLFLISVHPHLIKAKSSPLYPPQSVDMGQDALKVSGDSDYPWMYPVWDSQVKQFSFSRDASTITYVAPDGKVTQSKRKFPPEFLLSHDGKYVASVQNDEIVIGVGPDFTFKGVGIRGISENNLVWVPQTISSR